MKRQLVSMVVAIAMCLTVPLAFGQQRGKGNEKEKQEKPGEKQGKGAEPH